MNRHTLTLALALGTCLAWATALAQPPSKTAAKKPAAMKSIVLVHGAFAEGSSWDRVIPLLQAKGYTVVAVHAPFLSFADDVAATKRAIDAQSGEVILVGHSYGGVVITEAGNDPKVTGLVYVAAFAPDVNESINDLGKGQPPPPWAASLKADSGGFVTLPVETYLKDFAPDVPPAEAKVFAAMQAPIYGKAFDAKVATAAWKAKPSWYVMADQDRMIDPRAQAQMSKRMNATTTSVKASHVAMLSKPKEIADVIVTAATAPAVAKK